MNKPLGESFGRLSFGSDFIESRLNLGFLCSEARPLVPRVPRCACAASHRRVARSTRSATKAITTHESLIMNPIRHWCAFACTLRRRRHPRRHTCAFLARGQAGDCRRQGGGSPTPRCSYRYGAIYYASDGSSHRREMSASASRPRCGFVTASKTTRPQCTRQRSRRTHRSESSWGRG